jgi:hypothetical protein
VLGVTGLLAGGKTENQIIRFNRNSPHPAMREQIPSVSVIASPPIANIQPKSTSPTGSFCGMNATGPSRLSTYPWLGDEEKPELIHPLSAS